MTRTEYNELRYIKKTLRQLNPGFGSTLTIRTSGSLEYQDALDTLYCSLGFHPVAVKTDNRLYDDEERIIYIKRG